MEQRVEAIGLAEFLDWEATQEQKHELLHGRILAFFGASFDHNRIADNVKTRLNAGLVEPGTYGTDIIIETVARKADNGFRADVVVTCSKEDAGTGRYLKHPRIVVDVRSPKSNVGMDWEAKLLEYWSTPSILQLVIIESDHRSVVSYCRDESGAWLPPVSTSDAGTVDFPSVGLDITLADIYRRTTLSDPT
jgi:hypothetical protein